jgi:glycosyltransferase involved in cell wall biosynthesis
MQIGIDASRALRARRTGTERYSLEIIRHLLALPEAAAHQWRLYSDAQPDPSCAARLAAAGQRNVEWQILPARRLWTHRTLAAAVTHDRPEVLFVPAHVLPFTIDPRRLPPSVVTIHDLGYHWFPQAHTRPQRLYLEAGTRWSAAAATRVIAVSRATAADLNRVYDVAPAKIDVIHEACAAPELVTAEQVAAVRRQYGLMRPYALFVGTLQPRKNVVRLAQAYAALASARSLDFDLVLAGAPGWLSAPIVAELEALQLGARIRRLGYVPDEALPALLAGARLFCLVSLYEGFGLPVLEAQSYGVPVMTANNSSLPEVAGDAALLVDPTDVDAIADAMLRLSQDEPLRQQLIAAGHANVKRFSWEKAARETLEVLMRAAGTKDADERG